MRSYVSDRLIASLDAQRTPVLETLRGPPKGIVLALRTFIVEDNSIVLKGLTEALVEMAHVRIVGTAPSAVKANEWLAEHRKDWDIAVVDLFLLASSGLDVLRSWRERGADQRIIVLTNYATVDIRTRCAELGADAVFDKSTEIDELFSYFNDTPGSI